MENLVLETEFLEDVADGEVVVDEIPFSEPIVEPPELEEGEEAPPLPPLIPQGFAGLVSNVFGMQFQRRAWCTLLKLAFLLSFMSGLLSDLVLHSSS
jgi:hypothetical protein